MNLSSAEKEMFMDMFKSILDDDNGVNETAFYKMKEAAYKLEDESIIEMFQNCRACEGRFFIPENI